MRQPQRPSLIFLLIVSVISFAALLYCVFSSQRLPSLTRSIIETTASDARCAHARLQDEIVVVVKTGATEAYEKVPTQLLTLLQCSENLLLFSDLEQDIGPFHLHDSLATMSPDAMNNTDFAFYRALKAYQAEGRDVQPLGKMKDMRETSQTAGHNAAWALDKYKFLYITERAWEMAPHRHWYVFIEADTYLVWSNLLRWLQKFDPNEALFLGKAVPMHEEGDGFYFGHGGSGYILSRAAMHDYAVNHKGLASRWDYRVPNMWFGDYVQAKALKEELGLDITGAWPHLNSDKIATMPWSEGLWCQPVVTMHHVRPDEIQALWNYERRRIEESDVIPPSLTFEELFYAFVQQQQFPIIRAEWDNMSNDRDYQLETPQFEDLDPNKSPAACSDACWAVQECKQWSHLEFTTVSSDSERPSSGGVCYLSSVFRVGQERKVESFLQKQEQWNIHTWTSGWEFDRIKQWLSNARCEYPVQRLGNFYPE